MAFDKSNPAWQADTHFTMLEEQAQERHDARLVLGRGAGMEFVAEPVGPSIHFKATTVELQELTDALFDQQERYYEGKSNYLLYLTSVPLDNYRGIQSICWSLYQPFLE